MKVLILGSSLRGLDEVARICVAANEDVVMYDSEDPTPPADLRGRVDVLPRTWRPEYLDGVDRVVASPWFSEIKPPISDALDRGIEVITEAGFGLEHIRTPFVGITGTNGKTTVTEVVTEMLVASGVEAAGGGNLGSPVSGMASGDADILVLELSSYQLRFLGDSFPAAAALLNIAPDHLDWHGTFDAYTQAKARIFAGMAPDAVLAYNADDPVVASVVENAPCQAVACSGTTMPPGGNGVVDGAIVVNGHTFPAPVRDASFLFDLVAGATVALAVGASVPGVARAISDFAPGAHRRQQVETSDGITWIDDSKATNPHATVAAVAAHAPVILLAGGRNKGLDLAPIGTVSGITHLIAFGESGPEIAAESVAPSTVVQSLSAAVARACDVAGPGDTVLLSPGCASFDEFTSYAERGDVFQQLVTRRRGTAA
ncbi:MAG: UDP-N-acetylmuramoyl-L-alanine--D-glutamate ligase [Actinomycetota bacterium]